MGIINSLYNFIGQNVLVTPKQAYLANLLGGVVYGKSDSGIGFVAKFPNTETVSLFGDKISVSAGKPSLSIGKARDHALWSLMGACSTLIKPVFIKVGDRHFKVVATENARAEQHLKPDVTGADLEMRTLTDGRTGKSLTLCEVDIRILRLAHNAAQAAWSPEAAPRKTA